MLAAAVWVGGLLALAVGFWPLLRRDNGPARGPAARGVGARSAVSRRVSVGLLAVTGLYTAGRQVASIDALVATLYGQGLATKAGLLAIAGGLGLLGARRDASGDRSPDRPRRRLPRPRTLLVAEVAAGLAVLLAAALMSSTPPARGPDFGPATPVAGFAHRRRRRPAGHAVGHVRTGPAQNVLSAVVASTRRPDPPPPSGVDLRFPGRGIGVPMRKLAPGRFHLAGDQLSASGRSRIEVVVHRRGEPDRSVGFDWTTASARRRVAISDRPLEPLLTLAAALLAIAGAVAAPSPCPAVLAGCAPQRERRCSPKSTSRKDPS